MECPLCESGMLCEVHDCTCPRIKVGMQVTEHRNLSPHCLVHGAEHDRQADILFGGPK